MRESFGGPARWGGKRSVPVTGGIAPRGVSPPASEPEPEPEPPSEPEATDAAKALAAEHGVDLGTIEGSGAEGRITAPDVQAVLAEEEPEVGEVESSE